MCRFNLILINDNNAEEFLIKDGYGKFNNDLIGYRVYQKGYCNCGSFVGSLIEKKGMKYQDAIESCNTEKLDRLYKIRSLMLQPGYKERKEEFQQKQTKLCEELQTFHEHINNYEITQSDILQGKYNGQELIKQMGELYKEIGSMKSILENQPEYKEKHEAYMNFMQENEIMNASTSYFLTKEESDSFHANSVPLSELFQREKEPEEEDEEIIEMLDESFEMIDESFSLIIDEAIEKAENANFTKNIEEYNSYYKLFTDLLTYVPSFTFTTIWSEPKELKLIKTVDINSLIIDDLAFLDFDEMVFITR